MAVENGISVDRVEIGKSKAELADMKLAPRLGGKRNIAVDYYEVEYQEML